VKIIKTLILCSVILILLTGCNLPSSLDEEENSAAEIPQSRVSETTDIQDSPPPLPSSWEPPRNADEWMEQPVRGTVIEIGYGGPDEYNNPPYPSIKSLRQLYDLGVRVVVLEFQYGWTIDPPYQADEAQYKLLTEALDNVAAAGLYTVLSVRNGPGRNAMMPDVDDSDVMTTLYVDDKAQTAYLSMLEDMVARFKDRFEIIAWEPMVEPALDYFLAGEEDPPFPESSALWQELAERMIASIRDIDPERPIMIEPVNWGGPEGFELLEPFDDDNILYSLHTYEPFAFTHQQDPPYTAYPGIFDGEYFDQIALESLLEPVDGFQARYDVPIVVGEWGGIRWLPGIEQFISDQVTLFEQRGWGWFWYAWDDEEWDELGFELHMGSERDAPVYDPTTPAFAPIASAWQAGLPPDSDLQPLAFEQRADGALRISDPSSDASDQNPAFSPDGSRLVFSRFENGYNIGPASLWLLDLANGQTTRLTPVEDQDNVNLPGSTWNPATNRIVLASDRGESDDLWRIAPDGTDFTSITFHEGPPWYIEPSWSSDGEWVVFEADNNLPDDEQQGSIWKVRNDGSELTQLTDGPGNGSDDRQPNWSPQGDRILFQRHTPGSENWDIFTIAPDGSDLQQITTAPSSDTDASWSPDDAWIVYSSDDGGLVVPNILIIPANGGSPIRVSQDNINQDGAPSWSPDGQWIAFESHSGEDEDDPSALWLIAVP
jgi:TolB protein